MTFAYDGYGNRWQQNITAGSGPAPQLTFYDNDNVHRPNQVDAYQYDAVGNVINDGVHTYTYDGENQLLTIDGGSTATYGYNALNYRDYAAASGQILRFGTDPTGQRLTAWSSTGALTSAQYYANGTPYAFWSSLDSNIHFEHHDWVGTERVRTTANGAVEGTYGNFPFGESASSSGNDLAPTHFAQLDADVKQTSGLSHAMFRDYQATSGRWLSPDPYSGSYDLRNPQSLNRYSYVGNNPIAAVDPQGLATCDYSSICPDGPGNEPACAANDSCGGNSSGGQTPPCTADACAYADSPGPVASTPCAYDACASADELGAVYYTGSQCEAVNCIPSGPAGTLLNPFQGLSFTGVVAPSNGPAKGPYPTRLFGTHWCGPGGAGPTVNGLDAACQAHDQCYDSHGLTVGSNFNPFAPASQIQALQACNQQLCNAASALNDLGATRVTLYFQAVPVVGACHNFMTLP